MGYYVHLHVCFACDTNDGVATLARQELAALGESKYGGGETYARWFLDTLSRRTGTNPGPKGGLSTWGIVGNGPGIAEQFVEVLRPFWRQLLNDNALAGGPHSFEHVLVFYEEEGTEAANAYEIFWDDDDSPDRQLVVKHHERLPFSWMQM